MTCDTHKNIVLIAYAYLISYTNTLYIFIYYIYDTYNILCLYMNYIMTI